MADEIAKEIGWPTGSPFQFEVSMTNLALVFWVFFVFGLEIHSGLLQ